MDIENLKKQVIKLIFSQSSIINESQNFEQYIYKCRSQNLNNEETVVQPFVISFLKLLNYFNQHNLIIEERQYGNKPDFYSENFILECKSTRYDDFSKKIGGKESPIEQLERYLRSEGFNQKYGILFSLDRCEVYTLQNSKLKKMPHLSFSLVELLQGKDTNFNNFISTFYVHPLSIKEKIKIIAETEKKTLIPIQFRTFNKILKSLVKEITIHLENSFYRLPQTDDVTILIKSKVCQIKKQLDLKSTEEAEKEFISQTAYIILARILLTKCWEDLNLIDPPNTYNGGFKKYLEQYQEKIKDIYHKALNASQNIYYLFDPSNPYLLLDLPDELIIEILFEICKYDFKSLDYDILGYIYEDYLDIENRKKYGQYYTPSPIVNIILDRIGYNPQKNEFLDKSLLDPASGSGTFLLNAVNRVIKSKQDGNNHSLEYKEIIETKIFGSELMLFPYLLSEINILIQISPIIKDILEADKRLNVFHIFPNNSFNLINKMMVKRLLGIKQDEIQISEILDPALINRKKIKLEQLQNKNDFDFIVGNPPYVANDTNPELFREMKKLFTFCKETYCNKMDLFYWFIILGIWKLKEGGKLSFITTRYWIDKGEKTGVESLKENILKYCFFREAIDLRNVNIFHHARGQENIIFILEKKSSHSQDDFITIFQVQSRPQQGNCLLENCIFDKGYCSDDQEYLECLYSHQAEWDALLTDSSSTLGNYIIAYKSARKTSDLEKNRSWDIFHPNKGIIFEILNIIENSCKTD
ncbi:MAG: HsdM family class I SAM-dependent methyltransferase, partial [Promethearchaeota archaeon]